MLDKSFYSLSIIFIIFLIVSISATNAARGESNAPISFNYSNIDNSRDDTLLVDSFSPTSQLAYSIIRLHGKYSVNMDSNLKSLSDIKNVVKNAGLEVHAVKMDFDKLEDGDIIYLECKKEKCEPEGGFYIYRGIDNEGLVNLDDLNNRYVCPTQTIKDMFTKNILILREKPKNAEKIYDTDACKIIYKGPLQNPVQYDGPSRLAASIQSYNNEETNPEIQNKAKEIVGSSWSPLEKAIKIFNWVNINIDYEFYYDSRYYALGTLKRGSGNCCDQSRLVIALLRSVGFGAGTEGENNVYFCYAKIKTQKHPNIGHVWPGGILEGKRVPMDTTIYGAEFGKTNFTILSDFKRMKYLSF